MYTIKADGKTLYDPSTDGFAYQVLNPRAKFKMNNPGSLTFMMLPGNAMYDAVRKMKTILTLEQDGDIIFRGRATETTTDTFNQRDVYCEGDLAFLKDSLQGTYEFDGTAPEFFAMLIEKHNAQVEESKRFVIGVVTAVNSEDKVKAESVDYVNTYSEFKEYLLNEFKGYIRTRHENGVNYIDYIKEYDDPCAQKIEFGVNLVKVENHVTAQELCTVLIPLGKTISGSKRLTIADANGGKDYIEDAEGIAQFGRIVKTHTWDDVDDAEELLRLGQEHIQKMKEETTLTLTALDMHHMNVDADRIRLGSTVPLDSSPHGLDMSDICTEMELVIEDPDKSEYVFGKPNETLTDNAAARKREHDHWHLHLTETQHTLEIFIESANEEFLDVRILCDGLNSRIDMMAETIATQAVNIEANATNIKTNATNIETNAANIQTNAASIDVLSEDLLVVSGDIKLWGGRIEAAAEDLDLYAERLNAMADVIGFQTKEPGSDDDGEYVAIRLDGIEGTLEQHAVTIETNATNITTNATNIETNAADIDVLSKDLLIVSEDIKLWGDRIEAAAEDIVLLGEQFTVMADVIGLQTKDPGSDDDGEYVAVRLDRMEGTLEQHAVTIETNATNIQTNATNIETNATDIDVLSKELLVVSEDVIVWGNRIEAAAEDLDLYATKLNAMANIIGFETKESGSDDDGEYVAVRLDGIEGTLSAKADLILLDGYVKTTDLEAQVLNVLDTANIDYLHAQSLGIDGNSSFHGTVDVGGDVFVGGTLDAVNVNTVGLTIGGTGSKWTGGTVLTGIGTISQSKRFLNVMLADGSTAQLDIVTDVSITPNSAYIEYLGKS